MLRLFGHPVHREHTILPSRERVTKGTKIMNSLPLSPLVIFYLTRFYWKNRSFKRNLVPRPRTKAFPRSAKKLFLVCIKFDKCQILYKLKQFFCKMLQSCNNVALEHAQQFDFQYPPCRNMVAKRVQHVASNNVEICCDEMLRSFGWSLQMLGQQCCMLPSFVQWGFTAL